LEAVAEAAMERLLTAKLTPDEYALAIDFGLKAVEVARAAVKVYQDGQAFLRAEAASIDEMLAQERTCPGWADQS